MSELTYIEPTGEGLKSFGEIDLQGPIHMLNLLRFKPDGGRESYQKYSDNTMPLLKQRGAKLIYRGNGRMTVIGGESWDTIVIVEYPSRDAFFDMVGSEEYQKGVHWRTEALEDSRLVCMQPPK